MTRERPFYIWPRAKSPETHFSSQKIINRLNAFLQASYNIEFSYLSEMLEDSGLGLMFGNTTTVTKTVEKISESTHIYFNMYKAPKYVEQEDKLK
jgi:hypothetical protein